MKQSCPNCGVSGSFKPKKREPERGQVEVFIACHYCRWESVIRSGSKMIVELEMDIEVLEAKVSAGVPMHDVLARRKERLQQEQARIAHSG